MNTRRAVRRRAGNLRAVEPGQQAVNAGSIPAKQLRCRSGHHPFPLDAWEPPAPIPAGVSVMFASEGRYKLMEPCPVCWAATRVTYTHPGGGVDGYLKSSIVYGTNWVRMAMDQPRGRRVMRDEKIRRGPPGGPGGSAARQWRAELREWSDGLGLVNQENPAFPAWKTVTDKHYYPADLEDAYTLHLDGREEEALALVAKFKLRAA